MLVMSLLELFVDVDNFCQDYAFKVRNKGLKGTKQRGPVSRLSTSELMTIVIHFHQSGYRTFKQYYQEYVSKQLKTEFPDLVSYSRFIELMPRILAAMCTYLQANYGTCTGINFVDSTSLVVCHNRRIKRHKVFKGLAARGMTSMGWFFGFKLHLIVNDKGELLAVFVTAGNVDDREPLDQMTVTLFGKLFGDRGYLSQSLFERLYEQGLELITTIRKNMKNSLMKLEDKILLRKRFLIETINDQLKNISQIDHSRHRSVTNFAINLLAGLIAYTKQAKKPSLNLFQQPDKLPVLL
jgi:hypothetical protein